MELMSDVGVREGALFEKGLMVFSCLIDGV
jgi:hypothetical protein